MDEDNFVHVYINFFVEAIMIIIGLCISGCE